MQKIVFISLVLLILFGCQKPDDVPPVNNKVDVEFSGNATEIGNLKSASIVDCDNPDATYAKVDIDGIIYRPAVFYVSGVPYTQSIKMDVGVHTINEFMLMNDNNTPGNYGDDIIVSATPEKNSTYAQFVTKAVDFTFEVAAFTKIEVPIDVLCFEDADYLLFGFNWFALTEITVREQVFFGDICVSNPSDYAGSLYAGQANGLQQDMPAIFRIDVFKNGAFIVSYDNSGWLGEGQALEVQYPDNNNANDIFNFDLYIYVKENDEFVYKYYYTWTFNNDEKIDAGEDNVVDFVLGDCVADYDLKINAPVPNGCESAYAFSEDYATCFLEIQGLNTNKWGWSNGPLAVGNYEFQLYAGAGQCNLENGREVGAVTVDYDGTDVIITYNMLPGYTLDQVHVFAGVEILPRDQNDEFIDVPGQFTLGDEDLGGATTATYTISDFSNDDIYIVAHAEACGPGL